MSPTNSNPTPKSSSRGLHWIHVSAGFFSIIGCLVFLGLKAIPVHGDDSSPLRWFDLDRELNITTFFSCSLLFAAGGLAWLYARRLDKGQTMIKFLGAFFIFMGFDEGLKIHETAEKITNIDWQLLYLPLILAGGIGWLMIWWRNPGLPRLLWSIGAAAWVASQLLEACQWGWWWTPDEAIDSYSSLMVTEETLEMLGSTFFILTLFKINWPSGLKASSPARKSEGAPST